MSCQLLRTNGLFHLDTGCRRLCEVGTRLGRSAVGAVMSADGVEPGGRKLKEEVGSGSGFDPPGGAAPRHGRFRLRWQVRLNARMSHALVATSLSSTRHGAGSAHAAPARCAAPPTPRASRHQVWKRSTCVKYSPCEKYGGSEALCPPPRQCKDLACGNYTCDGCPGGYTTSRDGKECLDVDECAANNGGCHMSTNDCNNTIGSYARRAAALLRRRRWHFLRRRYQCVPCPAGHYGAYFLGKPVGSGCYDIDECAESTHDCNSLVQESRGEHHPIMPRSCVAPYCVGTWRMCARKRPPRLQSEISSELVLLFCSASTRSARSRAPSAPPDSPARAVDLTAARTAREGRS